VCEIYNAKEGDTEELDFDRQLYSPEFPSIDGLICIDSK